MNKKKRVLIYSVALLLFALGLLCILIASIIDDKVNYLYVNIIGFSFFIFWIAAIIILVKNYSNLVLYEINEKSDKMHRVGFLFNHKHR